MQSLNRLLRNCLGLLNKYIPERMFLGVCHTLSPVTPGKPRPCWVSLILLFFSPRMLGLWRRLALGITLGLLADTVTDTQGPREDWRDLL